MHALVVRFDVIPERLEDFDALVRVTQAGIRDHEDGTLVYTSMAMVDDPCARVFIEMYRDEDAFARHEEMAHTRGVPRGAGVNAAVAARGATAYRQLAGSRS